MRTSRLVVPVVVFLLGLSGACGNDNTNPSSGTAPAPGAAPAGAAAPVTLRIGTNDASDAPDTPAMINEFAQHVDQLSGGAMQVEPVWRAAGDPVPNDWDQVVARKVVSGELDMGLIPAAAWDAVGVTTLRALNAPFLVDSDALVAEVVSGPLAGQLLAGLGKVGVTGLGLWPDGLRHVFAFHQPLLSPDDFAGTRIRSPRSDTVYALLEALGATVDDVNSSDFDAAVADGSIAGAESSFARASSLPGGRQTVTGNVTLFPKVQSLVVNGGRFDALTDDQRAVIRDAAERTREGVIASSVDDASLAKRYCDEVGSVVLANGAQLAAFAAAAQSVYTDLEADAATKTLIESIRAVKAQAGPPSAVVPCQHAEGDLGSGFAGPVIPNGTYNRRATRADAIERGLDPSIVDPMLGADGEIPISIEIKDGRWTLYDTDDKGITETGDLGTYSYDGEGRWVTVSESGGCRGCIGTVDWTVADGVLHLAFAPVAGARPISDDERLMLEGDFVQTP